MPRRATKLLERYSYRDVYSIYRGYLEADDVQRYARSLSISPTTMYLLFRIYGLPPAKSPKHKRRADYCPQNNGDHLFCPFCPHTPPCPPGQEWDCYICRNRPYCLCTNRYKLDNNWWNEYRKWEAVYQRNLYITERAIRLCYLAGKVPYPDGG